MRQIINMGFIAAGQSLPMLVWTRMVWLLTWAILTFNYQRTVHWRTFIAKRRCAWCPNLTVARLRSVSSVQKSPAPVYHRNTFTSCLNKAEIFCSVPPKITWKAWLKAMNITRKIVTTVNIREESFCLLPLTISRKVEYHGVETSATHCMILCRGLKNCTYRRHVTSVHVCTCTVASKLQYSCTGIHEICNMIIFQKTRQELFNYLI